MSVFPLVNKKLNETLLDDENAGSLMGYTYIENIMIEKYNVIYNEEMSREMYISVAKLKKY